LIYDKKRVGREQEGELQWKIGRSGDQEQGLF